MKFKLIYTIAILSAFDSSPMEPGDSKYEEYNIYESIQADEQPINSLTNLCIKAVSRLLYNLINEKLEYRHLLQKIANDLNLKLNHALSSQYLDIKMDKISEIKIPKAKLNDLVILNDKILAFYPLYLSTNKAKIIAFNFKGERIEDKDIEKFAQLISIQASHDKKYVVCECDNSFKDEQYSRIFMVFNVENLTKEKTTILDENVLSWCLTSDNAYIFCALRNGVIKVFNWEGEEVFSAKLHDEKITYLKVTVDNKFLLTATEDLDSEQPLMSKIKIWKINFDDKITCKGLKQISYAKTALKLKNICLDPNGDYLLVGEELLFNPDKSEFACVIKIYSFPDLTCLNKITLPLIIIKSNITRIKSSDNGDFFLIPFASYLKTSELQLDLDRLSIISSKSGEIIRNLDFSNYFPRGISFSSNNEKIFTWPKFKFNHDLYLGKINKFNAGIDYSLIDLLNEMEEIIEKNGSLHEEQSKIMELENTEIEDKLQKSFCLVC